MIATTTAAAHNFLRRRQRICFRRRGNESYDFPRSNFLHNLVTEERAAQQQPDQAHVHSAETAIPLER